jgi:hypothetical protein
VVSVEYFIVANSFAAPFVSDESTAFQEAPSPEKALELFAARYSHPARLFAADCYESPTDFHKGKPALARWLCNHEIARAKAMDADKGCHSYLGIAPGRFEVDGNLIVVTEPFAGKCVPVPRQKQTACG